MTFFSVLRYIKRMKAVRDELRLFEQTILVYLGVALFMYNSPSLVIDVWFPNIYEYFSSLLLV
jgi:hypothetical protein